MAWVYILQSEKNKRYYIGSTNDLSRRICQHQEGLVSSTKNIRPLVLAFSQEIQELSKARSIEYRLKKFKSRIIIEKIIKDGIIKIAE